MGFEVEAGTGNIASTGDMDYGDVGGVGTITEPSGLTADDLGLVDQWDISTMDEVFGTDLSSSDSTGFWSSLWNGIKNAISSASDWITDNKTLVSILSVGIPVVGYAAVGVKAADTVTELIDKVIEAAGVALDSEEGQAIKDALTNAATEATETFNSLSSEEQEQVTQDAITSIENQGYEVTQDENGDYSILDSEGNEVDITSLASETEETDYVQEGIDNLIYGQLSSTGGIFTEAVLGDNLPTISSEIGTWGADSLLAEASLFGVDYVVDKYGLSDEYASELSSGVEAVSNISGYDTAAEFVQHQMGTISLPGNQYYDVQEDLTEYGVALSSYLNNAELNEDGYYDPPTGTVTSEDGSWEYTSDYDTDVTVSDDGTVTDSEGNEVEVSTDTTSTEITGETMADSTDSIEYQGNTYDNYYQAWVDTAEPGDTVEWGDGELTVDSDGNIIYTNADGETQLLSRDEDIIALAEENPDLEEAFIEHYGEDWQTSQDWNHATYEETEVDTESDITDDYSMWESYLESAWEEGGWDEIYQTQADFYEDVGEDYILETDEATQDQSDLLSSLITDVSEATEKNESYLDSLLADAEAGEGYFEPVTFTLAGDEIDFVTSMDRDTVSLLEDISNSQLSNAITSATTQGELGQTDYENIISNAESDLSAQLELLDPTLADRNTLNELLSDAATQANIIAGEKGLDIDLEQLEQNESSDLENIITAIEGVETLSDLLS